MGDGIRRAFIQSLSRSDFGLAGVLMKKYMWPLIVMLFAVVGMGTAEYVKVSNDRGHLLGQMEEAAEVVSAYPPESAEAHAAMERGTLIALGWPCHWWENREAARSKATDLFANLVASKLKRGNGSQAVPAEEPVRR